MSAESISEWRKSLDGLYAASERTEVHLVAQGLADLPFTIYGGDVFWIAHGHDHKTERSLEVFKKMVASVALKLGPPEHIGENASEWRSIPGLQARWAVPRVPPKYAGETFSLYVMINDPVGCKIDPSKPRVLAKPAHLHPECKAVLEGLEAEL